MGTIVFDPLQIGSNSSNVAVNVSDIIDNNSDITVNEGDITGAETDIISNQTVASDAASDASDAADEASDASVAAASAVSDVDVIEADNRYAKSIYSDPATDSFIITQIDIASDSKIYLSHSDVAE